GFDSAPPKWPGNCCQSVSTTFLMDGLAGMLLSSQPFCRSSRCDTVRSRRTSMVRVALLALAVVSLQAWAQAFPSKTVRIVIPFPPGGTSDILARTLAQKLTEEWGQQVIAENRPGAAGNVACEFVAKQKGDPHVLLINTVGTHAINPAIYPSLPFDPIKDFTLITNLVNLPSLLIVHPSVQATNAQELIALAKAKPGALSY